MSVKDRIRERKFRMLMRTYATYKKKRIVSWGEHTRHLYLGTADMSKTPAARKMNCIQRLRLNRETL